MIEQGAVKIYDRDGEIIEKVENINEIIENILNIGGEVIQVGKLKYIKIS